MSQNISETINLRLGVRWHRQLTENIGVRALVSRCYEVIGMAKDCTDMRELNYVTRLQGITAGKLFSSL